MNEDTKKPRSAVFFRSIWQLFAIDMCSIDTRVLRSS